MRLLVFGDLHIKASGKRPAYEELSISQETDAIIVVGDVVHRTDPSDLAAGREFYATLEQFGVPVYAVPGNHDPATDHRRMADGFDIIQVLHEDVVSLGEANLVGWGCEALQAEMSVTPRAYNSLDPRQRSGNRRYLADQIATTLEDALYEYVQDDLPETALRSELDIGSDEKGEFKDQLTAFEDRYATLRDLLAEAGSPVIVGSHLPPYGTDVDRHHSIGEREADMQELHQGSIALKIALRVEDADLILCGHSHESGYQILTTVDGAHLFNPGMQGVATLEYTPSANSFTFDRHT